MASTSAIVWCAAAIVWCSVAIAAPPAPPPAPEQLFGDVRITEPAAPARGFVVLFSGRKGWDAQADAAARALGRRGVLVAGVDLAKYLERIEGLKEKCHALAGDPEKVSLDLQRRAGFEHYYSPILAGFGEGGTLAEVMLSEAQPATLGGAVSVDPAVGLATSVPLCFGGATTMLPGAHQYGAVPHLEGFWSAGFSAAATPAQEAYVAGLRTAGMPVKIFERPGGNPADVLVELVSLHLQVTEPSAPLAALPLIELPVVHPQPYMAIILSGDGGWRDLDKSIAEVLHQSSVPVVGWDSLRYFWSLKTPEETTRDLAAVIEAYTLRWHTPKVILIGYSFGADVLPFLYNRLPPQQRAKVSQLSLLALSKAADFEIQVTGWLGSAPSKSALPVAPELAAVPAPLIQCFFGEQETDSFCPALAARGAQIIGTPGNHHFGGDYAGLAQRILEGAQARTGPQKVTKGF